MDYPSHQKNQQRLRSPSFRLDNIETRNDKRTQFLDAILSLDVSLSGKDPLGTFVEMMLESSARLRLSAGCRVIVVSALYDPAEVLGRDEEGASLTFSNSWCELDRVKERQFSAL